MPEPTTIAIPAGIAAVGVALVKWLLGREVERIDQHGERLDELEKQSISKVDLDRTETRIITAIADVKSTANAAHERIDRIRDRA